MTPTGRNRLLELLMQGVRPALRGDEPEQTGEILPLARYENGGVFPAVPKFIGNALQALSTTGKDTFPETTVADSPQTIQDALDYNNARRGMEGAIPLMGGGAIGAASGATKNALGIFGGRLAKTADHAALAKAEQMAAEGLPREQIWNDTGWFQGVDGKWRFEIDDSLSGVLPPAKTDLAGIPDSNPIDKVIFHENYYQSYPDAKSMKAQTHPGLTTTGTEGSYLQGRGVVMNTNRPDSGRSTALHELQHDAQFREGFARGASLKSLTDYEANMRAMIQRYEDQAYQARLDAAIAKKNGDQEAFNIANENLRNSQNQLQPLIQKLETAFPQSAGQMYRASAGEVEARTVQARRDLTAEQRRARAPWLDYDVPEDQQIVRFK